MSLIVFTDEEQLKGPLSPKASISREPPLKDLNLSDQTWFQFHESRRDVHAGMNDSQHIHRLVSKIADEEVLLDSIEIETGDQVWFQSEEFWIHPKPIECLFDSIQVFISGLATPFIGGVAVDLAEISQRPHGQLDLNRMSQRFLRSGFLARTQWAVFFRS